MGAGHDHGASIMRVGERHRGRLWLAIALLGGFTAVEVVAALLTDSLALLSDAGHMFTDVLGLGMALAAISAASRAARPGRGDPQRTFGLYRLEVLAALANAVLLSAVAVYVLIEAVRRFGDPPHVSFGPMLAVAIGGFVVNLVAFVALREGAKESLNLRGAHLEVLGDLLGSAGVIVAAVVIATTGWWYADPLVAVAVAVFILPRTWRLGRAAVRILVQAAPAHLDVAAVRDTLSAVPGVCDVHDLHVWTLASGMEVASAHLTLDPRAEVGAVLAVARETLHTRFHIDHATLQIEPAGATGACEPVGW
ncbi:MAG TPA: cation diffusion facilitator family transporter [Pilimelia sp.]|nr:cation diffusion facilitator family transporter [Pilimelia sp.]